jgi:epoxyqueuosine reductase
MGLIRGEVVEGGYKPSFLYRILKPKNITGNEINGVGESKLRRPSPIYHWFGILKVPFNRVYPILMISDLFHKMAMKHIKKSVKIGKQPYVPVAANKIEKNPEAWSDAIKQYALQNGTDLVGIKLMNPDWVFEGFEIKEKWIIVLGFQMDYSELSKLPEPDGGIEVLRVYANGQEASWNLANWLRTCGWDAKGFCGPMASPVSLVPAALAAGFGELGKHGSIINRTLGSNLRLGYVLTDIPLSEDKEDAFEADDFCTRCQVCTRACPPQAIEAEKQLVRGLEKWQVDFDKCLPYFNDTIGCGICIAVCPWSRPGVAPNLTKKLLRRKERLAA